MKNWILFAGLTMTVAFASCNDDGLDAITTVDSNFETGTDGWIAGFSEYSTATDTATLERRSGRLRLPSGLDTTKYAYMIQSHNRSDDMFMFLKKRITGLVPNGTYDVAFNIDLGTKYPEKNVGIGGSPGSAVYLKAGAAITEPTVVLADKFYKFTLDKGQQSQSGKDAVVLGNIGSGRTDSLYTVVEKSTGGQPFTIKVGNSGDLWLFVGTDSGFEGLTRLYYDRIRVTITEKVIN